MRRLSANEPHEKLELDRRERDFSLVLEAAMELREGQFENGETSPEEYNEFLESHERVRQFYETFKTLARQQVE